jgi:peptidoglycan hydrolase-like protein with peptidoglycan-binding domain
VPEEPRARRRAARVEPDFFAPRRKRGSRGFALPNLLPRRKTDLIALGCAVAASAAFLVNALALQAKPEFAGRPARPALTRSPNVIKNTLPAVPAPAARPTPAAPAAAPPPPRPPEPAPRPRAEIVTDIQQLLAERGYYGGAVDGKLGPRTDQAMKDFAEKEGVKLASEPSEAVVEHIRSTPTPPEVTASIPPVDQPSVAARILSVQRTLARLGYGPLRLNALQDPETKAAVERFERDRGLKPSGAVSEQLARELAAFSGAPLQ